VQLKDDMGSLFGSSEECVNPNRLTATNRNTATNRKDPPSPPNNPPIGNVESLFAGSEPAGVYTPPDGNLAGQVPGDVDVTFDNDVDVTFG
jgi:hypothetical protein